MNFLSQQGLSLNAIIYMGFQLIYIICGLVFLYTQFQILKYLKGIK